MVGLPGPQLQQPRPGVAEVTLSVDMRNHPARALYRGLGFEPYDVREVYLAVWSRSVVRSQWFVICEDVYGY